MTAQQQQRLALLAQHLHAILTADEAGMLLAALAFLYRTQPLRAPQ
jgi:hypothetical protein